MANFDITVKRGDTFKGLTFEFLLNGSPVDLTSAIIRMQVKKKASDSEAVLEFLTSNNTLVITDAINGVFQLPESIIEAVPKVYVYDVEMTLNTGRVITPFNGNFEVTEDVTR